MNAYHGFIHNELISSGFFGDVFRLLHVFSMRIPKIIRNLDPGRIPGCCSLTQGRAPLQPCS